MTKDINVAVSDKKTVYEIGYILVSTIPEEKVSADVTAIKDVLDAGRASTISEEAPRLRPLAYKIKKKIGGANQTFDTGYFGWIKFEAVPEAVIEIKKRLNQTESLLRFLLIVTVRENTVYGNRLPKEPIRPSRREIDARAAEKAKPKMSEEEIEKTIEQLVVE
jgi:ribosomal protein S6